MKIYGVIMAGGGGTRFWPLSRQCTPKQLLNLTGKDLMINETVERLKYITDEKDIFIVTNISQVTPMIQATKGSILENHILSEPAARNTAACVGYAAMEIVKKYGDGIMVITPADHYIKDNSAFVKIINKAIKAAEEQDKLVTVGITPTFASTGFGYIKYNKDYIGDAKLVESFKEKPCEDAAKEYFNSGVYAWNSGMFVWKASTILKKFEMYVPEIYNDLVEIGNSMNTDNEYKTIEQIYPNIRKISIDYAIMEPSAEKGDVLVVPGEFGWNDVGTWDMLDVLNDSDDDGNVTLGDTMTINTSNSIVYSQSKFIATVGVKDLIIVETDDAIMVCKKDRAQDVKSIVDKLNDLNRNDLL